MPRAETLRLSLLFGMLYFAQGIAEPTEGLIAQPVRSLLADWQFSEKQIGAFAWAISLPWWFKPLYGFLSDFVPLAGFRRKGYLILATGAASATLLAMFWVSPPQGSAGSLLAWLLIPTVGIAMADVAVDGLMIEKGQPLGITGRLQSVQWSAMYLATILTGSLGGWLSHHQLQSWGFLLCGLILLPTFVMALLVREQPANDMDLSWRAELRLLILALRNPSLLAMCGFLLLWNLNPFSSTVLQLYMTRELRLSEQFYGHTVSLQAIAAVVASACYGLYCRRVPLPMLLHGSILCGILATIGYWLLSGQSSAVAISLVVGFVYMTGSLIQMDLAARSCPIRLAASLFALLMAVSNVGLSLSPLLGGYVYEHTADAWNHRAAFHILVGIGAATTASCWLLIPWLSRGNSPEPKRAAVHTEMQPTRN